MVDECLLTKDDSNSSRLWHLRFGHLNYHFLKEMSSRKLVEGLALIRVYDHIYRSCLVGNQSHTPFLRSSSYRANAPLKLLFADICGPISLPTLRGSQYFLIIVDDWSRLMWVVTLKHKSKAFAQFKKFKLLAKVEKGTKLVSSVRQRW